MGVPIYFLTLLHELLISIKFVSKSNLGNQIGIYALIINLGILIGGIIASIESSDTISWDSALNIANRYFHEYLIMNAIGTLIAVLIVTVYFKTETKENLP